MSWSARLLSAMAGAQQHPLFMLRTVAVNDVIGLSYTAASDPNIGDPVIAAGGVTVNGPALQVGSWSSTLGTFTVQLCGDLSAFKRAITRGTFVEVLIGYPGWAASDYEVIATGQAQQIRSGHPLQATLECRDLLSAIRSRPTSTAGRAALGYRLANGETTVSLDYTAGDPTLKLTNASAFDAGYVAGGALVEPSGGGDPFVVRFTGKATNTLTGCTVTHGTVDADALAASVVRPLWFCEGAPPSIARAVLLSVLGTNVHTYDILPQGDGFSLPYSLIDHVDTDIYASAVALVKWEIISDGEISDPVSWMQGWLALGALFLTVRMGLLTVRGWLALTSQALPDVAEVVDADIEAGTFSVEYFDSDTPVEYEYVRVATLNGEESSTVAAASTLPSAAEVVYDLSDVSFHDEAADRSNVLGRVTEAHTRIPERYSFRCIGLRLAFLAPGDRIRITTGHAAGRLHTTLDGLASQAARVVRVSVDYGRASVSVDAVAYPQTTVFV